jgi:ABC-2 type transport system permease protein
MLTALRWLSAVLPLTWAYDGLSRGVDDRLGGAVVRDAAIVVGSALLALALGATTLRRRTE